MKMSNPTYYVAFSKDKKDQCCQMPLKMYCSHICNLKEVSLIKMTRNAFDSVFLKVQAKLFIDDK